MHFSKKLKDWVKECEELCKPDKVYWCNGSQEEYDMIIKEMLADKTLMELNKETYPNCYLHYSNPNDVARVEHLTFICTKDKDNAGPTNQWKSPEEMKKIMSPIFDKAMKGRTMYVIPYIMGPTDAEASKVGVEITDSPYVVANMRIMTRMGQAALDKMKDEYDFVAGLHSVADCNPERRYIAHFPEEYLIWSVGSGYGGNALLGKKCFALRIASWLAKEQGWMAEHMLILGLETPDGNTTYITAALPSACGKTNLAMMVSALENEGYKVTTVGDDIAWMYIGDDGRLYAINPEAGFFGVAPGTNEKTNPNAIASLHKNSIFTNTARTGNDEPWWEGMTKEVPSPLWDWQGKPYNGEGKAAHPNSRFTAPASQCPSISPHWQDGKGVPISAILFGGRRATTVPLVYESFDWQHGVFVGATMSSETTAAATGAVGVVRRDPFAMLPFCGYNMGDYFEHWLDMGKKLGDKAPKIFNINWFRTDEKGNFLWPGFGNNARVLKWIYERINGKADAKKTAIGYVPTSDSLDLKGLNIKKEDVEKVLEVKNDDWKKELPSQKEFFDKFGNRLPKEMTEELNEFEKRLN
ncbi:MAG TPA: phosphoenolpyruvate carboxykinase (GTP) [Ignavibacteria bacterium]|nr:phosphoenolpyruvate carboxykinase (GTP) [Ignavibacteria bacterium]